MIKTNTDLRDYFAGQALQGLLANSHLQKEFLKDTKKIVKEYTDGEINDSMSIASYLQYHHSMIAYAFADAMLEQRNSCTKKQYKEGVGEGLDKDPKPGEWVWAE